MHDHHFNNIRSCNPHVRLGEAVRNLDSIACAGQGFDLNRLTFKTDSEPQALRTTLIANTLSTIMSQTRSIIVFKDAATADEVKDVMEQVKQQGGRITNVYDAIMKGFAADVPNEYLHTLQSLSRIRGSAIDYIGKCQFREEVKDSYMANLELKPLRMLTSNL
ncbi:hypothetical protein D9615_002513 [Tricholomella constricta]|uniref:Uncharacterized protein n=1 Tax=Tricholomella constricta TaxID=117010 RepID=A0A8H5M900_9AGAR|nr:hypothetical protein D9615_002513 [Tricholomella constricta]